MRITNSSIFLAGAAVGGYDLGWNSKLRGIPEHLNGASVMRSKYCLAFCALQFVILVVSRSASAVPIEFIISGSSDGKIGNSFFPVTTYTITSFADTSNLESAPGSVLSIDHDSSSIAITGVGTFQFTSSTRTFLNTLNSIGLVGFSRGGLDGTDLISGPTDNAFINWDMMSSIGPISGLGGAGGWDVGIFSGLPPAVVTNAGQLILSGNNGRSSVTFQAILIPEPSTLALLALGGLGLIVRKRLRSSK